MREVPRHRFVPDRQSAFAYLDRPCRSATARPSPRNVVTVTSFPSSQVKWGNCHRIFMSQMEGDALFKRALLRVWHPLPDPACWSGLKKRI